ncbi:hypothetical protein Pla110_07690 [Polystyrenella longa]|uniref:Uncharacterized protein n=1 Tax=Polystyrenella longa TaxID=2528007 RepID=A0A518CIK5_9PLAN|nr:hypothetical protein [Polystyrenella longa]QDU79065.1 hypothetical protein Pla110_07690 [Polystyrenella longa]
MSSNRQLPFHRHLFFAWHITIAVLWMLFSVAYIWNGAETKYTPGRLFGYALVVACHYVFVSAFLNFRYLQSADPEIEDMLRRTQHRQLNYRRLYLRVGLLAAGTFFSLLLIVWGLLQLADTKPDGGILTLLVLGTIGLQFLAFKVVRIKTAIRFLQEKLEQAE